MSLNTLYTVQEIVLAQTESGPPPSPLGGMLPMFLMMIFAMYFIMIRPQQKRERQRQDMLSNLSKGDQVLTMGGIYGKIVGLDEQKVVVRISEEPTVKIELVRTSVAQVITDEK